MRESKIVCVLERKFDYRLLLKCFLLTTMILEKPHFTVVILLGIIISSCQSNSKSSQPEIAETIPIINYSVVNYFPHDTTLFTEGFLFHDGLLYESTGSPSDLFRAKSMIGITDLATGKFDKKIELDKSKYFGEGIAFVNGKLFQLTYKNQIGFIYDAKSFKKTGEFKYNNLEGWSLTTNGKDLIMSDGTSNLTIIDPVLCKPIRTLSVTQNGLPVDLLNELEYIKGFIYANVWKSNFVLKINPDNGKVVGKLDLSSLTFEAENKNPNADVLNGIAYDSTADKIYVTGKMWPNIYRLNFAH
jgi:glutamine cyclotransferase